MKRRLNILAFSPNDWNGQWVNRQQLLSRIAAHFEVVYSKGAFAIWNRGDEAYRNAALLGAVGVAENGVLVDEPGRLALRWPRFSVWDRWILRGHAHRLQRAFADPAAPLVAYVCHPCFWPYVRALQPQHVVYHCYDLYERQPGWTVEFEQYERALLERADLVFSPSRALSDMLERKAACRARVLPNAADIEAIASAIREGKEPPDLSAIPRPRIGYVGSIHPQLDLSLIATLAGRHLEWSFVLIGPEQKVDQLHADPGYRRCRSCKNVFFLGERHRSLVPSYLLGMNANIMFYTAGPQSWTEVAYPLKLHEYMACGRPIVSVPLEAIKEMAGMVCFAADAEAWDAALSAAVREHDPEMVARRRSVAALHSWDNRAALLRDWLLALEPSEAGPRPGRDA